MKMKIVLLIVSLTTMVGCGSGGSGAGMASPVAQETPDQTSDSQTLDAAADTTAEKPAEAPKNGILSGIGNFLGGLFGSSSSNGGTPSTGGLQGNAVACGVLPSILKYGTTYLTGGNAIVGSVVGGIANALLKCKDLSALASLLPQGSSKQEVVFNVISQLLKLKEGNQDIMGVLNSLKNPKDIAGIINILSTLSKKTNDSKIKDVLNMVIMLQAANGQINNTDNCGTMNATACKVFNTINFIRNQKGLPSLTVGAACTQAAQTQSMDMALNNFLSHLNSDGVDVKERLAKLGIGAPWAELIVKGSQLAADDAVEIWMNSENHKNKILSDVFTSMGVGFANGYFTTCFN